MRYGRPRRNTFFEISGGANKVGKVGLDPDPDLDPEVNPEMNPQIQQKKRRVLIWQCVNAVLSFISLSVFISILLFLFIVFHNVDNKPWTSIFTRMGQD